VTELRQALDEISAIRAQVARDTQFRGYGPISIASSGVLALVVAAVQERWLPESTGDVAAFLLVWVSTAALSVVLTTCETINRARRVHSGFAGEMLHSAVEQFLPAIICGVLLTVALTRVAPKEIWMLPGLWQMIFSLGVFASCRFLPRQMFAVGIWYLASGFACLMLGSGPRILSPWEMGIPFGVGQLLVAAVLHFGFGESLEES
jgi:hypothetical protein